MAYAAVVSLAHTIDLTLNHPKYSISPQQKHQMICVKKKAIFLQEFLEDFPEKAESFEGIIRELIQVAEDILELSMFEHIQQSLDSSENHQHLRYNSFDKLNKIMMHIEIYKKAMEIMNITARDELVRDSGHVPSTSAPIHKETMVGLEHNLMEVKLRLCRDSSKLEILPIVGMGGIGKTTLARNVYDDPLIMEYFHIREWVMVSQDYNVEGIVSDLLVSMKVFDKKEESMEAHHVYQYLKSRRYLIVLDDVWSTEAWDDLRMMFPDDGNGSRIMITTRLSNVASYPDPYSHVHEMQLMDEDQSWNLLRHRVFKQDPCPVELEDVGKMIVGSCRGLPLAIVVISGLLVVNQAKDAWQNIVEDAKSAISANDEQFNKILSLSYRRLPHHLRACFLYMGGFPDDYQDARLGTHQTMGS